MQSTRPLYSFEDSCDYVYDSMWSPTHPALFACVDLAGRLDLWNLNNDTEVGAHVMHVRSRPARSSRGLFLSARESVSESLAVIQGVNVNTVFSLCCLRFPLPVCLLTERQR